MSPIATPSHQKPAAALRHRRSVRQLTSGQLRDLEAAFSSMAAIGDDRGYQHWAGIHGLPLPMYCTHGNPLFLPWHRAYLWGIERALQDRVAGVTLAWWDWTHGHAQGIPPAFATGALASSPIQPSGRADPSVKQTFREPGAPGAPPLPDPEVVDHLLGLGDFLDFQTQLEDVHNGIHVWVGGTMGDISTAAYDPLFWAHHTMIDRIWRLWQIRHPGSGPPATLLGRALPPFPMTVKDTLDSDRLGYDYAAATTAVKGTR